MRLGGEDKVAEGIDMKVHFGVNKNACHDGYGTKKVVLSG